MATITVTLPDKTDDDDFVGDIMSYAETEGFLTIYWSGASGKGTATYAPGMWRRVKFVEKPAN
jgi:hypothetical protein